MTTTKSKTDDLVNAVNALDIPLIQKLVECGANLNEGSPKYGFDGSSLVALAIKAMDQQAEQHAIMATYHVLVDLGATMSLSVIKYLCQGYCGALFQAMANNSPEYRDLLIDDNAQRLAITYGGVEILKQQYQYGAKLLEFRAPDMYNNTALHQVGMFNYPQAFEKIQFLLSIGHDVNIKNSKGDTPLHVVQDSNALKLLLAAGAAVNEPNALNQTPVFFAKSKESVDLLLAAGADRHWLDKKNRSAVWEAWKHINTSADTQVLESMLTLGFPTEGKPYVIDPVNHGEVEKMQHGLDLIKSATRRSRLTVLSAGPTPQAPPPLSQTKPPKL